MNDIDYFYSVMPGVVCTGRKTRVCIAPLDCRYDFSDDTEYLVETFPLTRRRRENAPDFTAVVRAKGNRLCFERVFDNEEEYFIKLFYNDGRKFIAQLTIYALAPDLWELELLKGDTHVHTCRSDGLESPAVACANYRSAGFDFMAVTDHGNFEGSLEMLRKFRDVPLGMTLVRGEEVHAPDNYVHVVNFGSSESVNEIFQKDEEAYRREVGAIAESEDIPYCDRFLYAANLWVARRIRERDGLAILCHPHWITGVYNIPDELLRLFLTHGVFDAFELIGGQSAHENNMQTAFWNQLRSQGARIPVVGASDSHGTINRGLFNKMYTVCFARSRSVSDIQEAIRSGRAVACEVYEDSVNYTVHGEYRYVSFARYLIEHYFPKTAMLCAEEGRYMRGYLLGEEGAGERLGALAPRTREFCARFCGKDALR